jgi:hypothetical protein
MGGSPITLVTSGGIPVTNTAYRGPAFTPVASGGIPATLVASGGMPVTLVNADNSLWVSGGPTYDADAARLFTKFATDPGATRKQLISDRYVAGKQKSFWAKLDALWVHAAHGPEAGRLDWIDSFGDRRYDCLPVSSPAFIVDRGYMGDGLASYLDTQFNPATATSPKYSLNSATLVIRSNTDNTGSGSLAGFYDGAKGTTLNPRDASNRAGARVNQAGIDFGVNDTVPNAIGMYCETRTGAAVMSVLKDGVKVLASSTASGSLASGNLRLGSISSSSFRACQFSMGALGSGFTDQEAIDLFNWFEPYRTAVGVT